MKKFYTLVSKHKDSNGYAIHLDGKPVKTPSGAVLIVPSSALADLVVKEWAEQDQEIIPDEMPLTQLANTAQDRVSRERAAMQAAILKFLDTDLLCYRILDHQETLMDRQAALYDPWIEWFEKIFDHRLSTTTALAALKHPPEVHETVHAFVNALDDQRFTALQVVVPLAGSLVLGLAFIENALSPEQLAACVNVEEDFKAEIYNESFYGRAPLEEKKFNAMMRDLKAARAYLNAL